MNSQIWWHVARATGLVSWVMLTLSVVWGLALSTRILQRRPKAAWILDLHRHIGGVAVIYTIVHVAALIADDYVQFTLRSVLVPLASEWKPAAVAWGIAAFYLLVAIEISSLTKRYLSKRLWRRLHLLSLPLLVVAHVHAFTAGTDTSNLAAQGFAIVSGLLIAFLTLYRLLTRKRARVAGTPEPLGDQAPPVLERLSG